MLQRTEQPVRYCLKKAEECEQRASSALSVEVKEKYLWVAAVWRRVAENEDQINRANAFLGKRTG